MMDFSELILKRYSVRAYSPDPIDENKILTVLNAARLAPTASNRQPFRIIVVHTKGREEELLSIYRRDWFVQAPLVLCLCGIPSIAWVRKDGKKYLGVDIGIVMDHIVLAATEVGLGTCIIAAFDEQNARKILSIPDDLEPMLFTPLGYPADIPGIKKRMELEKLVGYEKW
jgi:nitroreductase